MFDPHAKPLKSGLNEAPPITQEEIKPVTLSGTVLGERRKSKLFFNLGALYEIVRIDRDMLRQFKDDTGYSGAIETYEYSNDVLTGLRHWGRLVQSIDVYKVKTIPGKFDKQLKKWNEDIPVTTVDLFRLWVLNLLFVNRATQVWWRPAKYDIQIPDPGRVDRGVFSTSDTVPLWVLLPFGNRGACFLQQDPAKPTNIAFSAKITPPEKTIPGPEVWAGKPA